MRDSGKECFDMVEREVVHKIREIRKRNLTVSSCSITHRHVFYIF